MTIDLKLPPGSVKQAVSTQGAKVQIEQTTDGIRLTMPLKSVDIVLLK
jgi:hypothetical protein